MKFSYFEGMKTCSLLTSVGIYCIHSRVGGSTALPPMTTRSRLLYMARRSHCTAVAEQGQLSIADIG